VGAFGGKLWRARYDIAIIHGKVAGFSRAWWKPSGNFNEAMMAAHVYHEIYLHLTWHTKESLPLITPEIEPEVFQFFRDRCVKTKGVYLHGVNGTPTHVHLAINIEPHVTISDLVRDLKGACSFELNKLHGRKILQWQRGFGVVSFGKQNLDWVLAYIANQKQHHAAGTDLVRMETTEMDDELEAEA